MASDDTQAQTEIASKDVDALLEELKAASKLMDDIAAASHVLPPQYRRKADAMGRNLKTLYDTGRRSADAALNGRD